MNQATPLKPTPLLVSREDAADALGISKRQLDYMIADKLLRPRRNGRRVLIPFSELRQTANRDIKVTRARKKKKANPTGEYPEADRTHQETTND